MKTIKGTATVLAIVAIHSLLAVRSQAELLKIDYGSNQNDADSVTLTDWDVIGTWLFTDFPDGVAKWKLTDWSTGAKNTNVTLTIMDNAPLSAQVGAPALGMTGNNPTHEGIDVVYDGIKVPYVVKDDYLYRNPDTAGTELLFRFANLSPGKYNITLFLGRTTDSDGQFGKVWVDDINGKKEPATQNTGNFTSSDPQGNPQTITLDIKSGDYLWYAHMEDNSGGISGMIIRTVSSVVDSDGDGMPDDWEIANGLNPHDPSDAGKDCNGNGLTNLQEYNLGLSPCDTTKPEIVSIASTATFDTVKLTFNTPLDVSTATNAANYSISPSLAVTAAASGYASKVVTLTTAKQTPATTYKLTITGVKNMEQFTLPTNKNSVTFYSYYMTKQGVAKFSYYGGSFGGGDPISGTTVDLLTADPRYPNSPNLVGAVYSLNSRDVFPDDSHDNYGATIEGYLTPTDTARYRFFLRSDDSSQFWLSTDDTAGSLVQIAEQTGCCNAFTEPDSPLTSDFISLTAGKRYFFRLIYKEGTGADYGQVAWRKEGDTTSAGSLTPIPGKYISSAVDLPYPADGVLVSQSPTPDASNVKPNAPLTIVHLDGKSAWTSNNVSMKLDDAAVSPTFTKDGTQATITYAPSGLFASGSSHTVALTYPDPAGNAATVQWSFTVSTYSGPTKDVVKGLSGFLLGKAKFTDDKGGHTGKPGDYAIDFGKTGGAWVDILNALFLNDATKNDQLSVSLWVNKYDIANSSAFWFISPSSNNGQRGFQAHIPWGDDNIYFDTAGCCDTSLQRINAPINTFPGYSPDDTWWNKWHHFVFTKKAGQKNIYIDGQLFLNGSSTSPLPTDFNEIALGTDGNPGGDYMHGLIDDFAIFSTAVSAANAAKLASGTSPKDLTGETLIAYWPFDDAVSTAPPSVSVGVARSANGITITFTGTLQSADKVTGPWADVPGASPQTATTTGAAKFYRARQ